MSSIHRWFEILYQNTINVVNFRRLCFKIHSNDDRLPPLGGPQKTRRPFYQWGAICGLLLDWYIVSLLIFLIMNSYENFKNYFQTIAFQNLNIPLLFCNQCFFFLEKGGRPYQEDRHQELRGRGAEDSSLYGVFDGNFVYIFLSIYTYIWYVFLYMLYIHVYAHTFLYECICINICIRICT